jgi:hypothetical protein
VKKKNLIRSLAVRAISPSLRYGPEDSKHEIKVGGLSARQQFFSARIRLSAAKEYTRILF